MPSEARRSWEARWSCTKCGSQYDTVYKGAPLGPERWHCPECSELYCCACYPTPRRPPPAAIARFAAALSVTEEVVAAGDGGRCRRSETASMRRFVERHCPGQLGGKLLHNADVPGSALLGAWCEGTCVGAAVIVPRGPPQRRWAELALLHVEDRLLLRDGAGEKERRPLLRH
eukprot:gene19135-5428_t